jgi:hypothetical protein
MSKLITNSRQFTAGQITHFILGSRWTKSFTLPRYTPMGWWECDIFQITKAGYWVEYEIKTSIADFKADAGKRRFSRDGGLIKHDQLAARSTKGPSRFFFVAPKGLLTVDMIPEWAGLIEVYGGNRLTGEIRVKDAPRLHEEKASEQIVISARDCCYWRFHRESRTAFLQEEEWVI